jgi:glucose-6-phosphate isomerase
LTPHFLSNVDGHALQALLPRLNPETTLFIIASKTFSTQETLMNAHSVRQWFLEHAKDEKAIARHFVAISTNEKAVQAFGIDPANMFIFWDWVGGRYSVWSAIGLIAALTVGFERFEAFLQGAYAMDQHFYNAPFDENMPVILGLLGFWYIDFWDAKAHAVLPYDERLARLPAYLQQLEMESNGKSATIHGHLVDYATAPVIFGEPGTNGQHAFYQKLHQGPDFIPADFIAILKPHHDWIEHHKALLANCFGQMEALMRGKSQEEIAIELLQEGYSKETLRALLPHRIFPGNRPSNAIVLPELTPKTLGALIALYEHKVYVQSVLWEINAFDQWGVEFGKKLANTIRAELGIAQPAAHHTSTAQLIGKAQALFATLDNTTENDTTKNSTQENNTTENSTAENSVPESSTTENNTTENDTTENDTTDNSGTDHDTPTEQKKP